MKILIAVFALMFFVVGSAKGQENYYMFCNTPEQVERVVAKMPNFDEANAQMRALNKEAGRMVCNATSYLEVIKDLYTVKVGGTEYIIIAVIIYIPYVMEDGRVNVHPLPKFSVRVKPMEGISA